MIEKKRKNEVESLKRGKGGKEGDLNIERKIYKKMKTRKGEESPTLHGSQWKQRNCM